MMKGSAQTDARAIFLSALAALLAFAAPSSPHAAVAAESADVFAGAAPVSDADLREERGGFITAAGVTFDIGASVETTVNGTLALVSNISLTPAGQVQQTTWINPNLPNATPINANTAAALAAAGINLSGFANASGVAIKQDSGLTAVLTNLAPGALSNLVINTANGQTIRQTTNITLTLPGFAATQAQAAQVGLFFQLSALQNAAQLGSVGH